MKKVIIVITVIVVAGLLAMSAMGRCVLEDKKTHQVAIPIVEALVTYIKSQTYLNEQATAYFPSFKRLDGIPYKDIHDYSYIGSYYFKYDNGYYNLAISGKEKDYIILEIKHNQTVCVYRVYENGKVVDTYLKPDCRKQCGSGTTWFRQ